MTAGTPRLTAQLVTRGSALRSTRDFFFEQGFLEVETPVLTPFPGLEPHLDPLCVPLRMHPDQGAAKRWLHTSPEIALKRVLAAFYREENAAQIYQLAHVFRDGESGPLHRPEFSMLEWYRAPGSLDDLIADCQSLGKALVDAVAPGCSLFAEPFDRRSVAELFAERGIDLGAALDAEAGGEAVPTRLAQQARAAGFALREQASFEDVFFDVMDKIEPTLGLKRPVVVERYPRSMAVLARHCDDDPRYAARFELYARGVEIANAFDELTDPVEQKSRFAADNAYRTRLGKEVMPIDEAFLEDLAHLPRCAGIALGFDRFLMVILGKRTFHEVVGVAS